MTIMLDHQIYKNISKVNNVIFKNKANIFSVHTVLNAGSDHVQKTFYSHFISCLCGTISKVNVKICQICHRKLSLTYKSIFVYPKKIPYCWYRDKNINYASMCLFCNEELFISEFADSYKYVTTSYGISFISVAMRSNESNICIAHPK